MILFSISGNTYAQTPASTDFTVLSGPGSPSSGSLIIHYEGESVQVNYTSAMSTMNVASAIRAEINSDNDIQVVASLSGSADVILTEKRPGSIHNGNMVEIDVIGFNHITVSGDTFFMSGGTN